VDEHAILNALLNGFSHGRIPCGGSSALANPTDLLFALEALRRSLFRESGAGPPDNAEVEMDVRIAEDKLVALGVLLREYGPYRRDQLRMKLLSKAGLSRDEAESIERDRLRFRRPFVAVACR